MAKDTHDAETVEIKGSEMTADQRAEFMKMMDALRVIVRNTVYQSYQTMMKKLKRICVKHGYDPPPQSFWMEVGMAMVDELMVCYPMQDGSQALTSTRKGYLIPAEYLVHGAMWEMFCAGTRIDEFMEKMNDMIEKRGKDGRDSFVMWWEQQESRRTLK